MPSVEDSVNAILTSLNIEIRFSQQALKDLTGYKKEQQETILALILARAKNGPLIRPNGIGEPLHGELHGFTKIKPQHLGFRVTYRPIQTTKIIMEIIAIGPSDPDKVYANAVKRLTGFRREISERNQTGSTHNNI